MLKNLNPKTASSNELAHAFVEAVSIHFLSTDDKAGIEAANRAALSMKTIGEELLIREDGVATIQRLLSNENPFVQLWISPYGLKLIPEETQKLLKSLQEHNLKKVRFKAGNLLEVWQDGLL